MLRIPKNLNSTGEIDVLNYEFYVLQGLLDMKIRMTMKPLFSIGGVIGHAILVVKRSIINSPTSKWEKWMNCVVRLKFSLIVYFLRKRNTMLLLSCLPTVQIIWLMTKKSVLLM